MGKMNANEFEKWVEKKYHDMIIATSFQPYQITNLSRAVDKGIAISGTGFTITFVRKNLTLRICNAFTGKTGKAKCNINDVFSFKKGLAIAWARYCQDSIPELIERFKVDSYQLKNGDVFYKDEYSTKRYIYIGPHPLDEKFFIALSNTYQPVKLDFTEVMCEPNRE